MLFVFLSQVKKATGSILLTLAMFIFVIALTYGINVLIAAAIIKLLSLVLPITFSWYLSAIVGAIMTLRNIFQACHNSPKN